MKKIKLSKENVWLALQDAIVVCGAMVLACLVLAGLIWLAKISLPAAILLSLAAIVLIFG